MRMLRLVFPVSLAFGCGSTSTQPDAAGTGPDVAARHDGGDAGNGGGGGSREDGGGTRQDGGGTRHDGGGTRTDGGAPRLDGATVGVDGAGGRLDAAVTSPDAAGATRLDGAAGRADLSTDGRITVVIQPRFCAACSTDATCDGSDSCIDGRCLPRCSSTCPDGFGCAEGFCVPDPGHACCIDGDGDGYGVGGGCLGPDCDDTSAAFSPAAPEVCDGLDNNCNRLVDDGSLCAPGSCAASGAGFAATPPAVCAAVFGCVSGGARVSCGLYGCAGSVCATTCADDGGCVAGAFCDGTGHCVADEGDGAGCARDGQCASGHCANAFCCAPGATDCCAVATDCPASYTTGPVCDDPASCQGTRHAAACGGSTCGSTAIPDDSACTGLIAGCGPYPPATCTGAVTQSPPTCATSCADNSGCDADAHCTAAHVCEADGADGTACAGDGDCASNHCANGFCCASGVCCGASADCPAAFSAPPVCNDAATCQGTRTDATCVAGVCGSAPAEDDRACTASVSDCGLYPAVGCNGAADQTAPSCATSCAGPSDCDAGAHCSATGTCAPAGPDGAACVAGGDCLGGHCGNGFCCAPGATDCCAVAADCPASYTAASACNDAANCQGSRADATCASSICGSTVVDDDSVCAGQVANACGYYLDQRCTSATAQSAPTCPSSCTDDSVCDLTAHCEVSMSTCYSDGVIINEVSPRGLVSEEFVELYNTASFTVDLGGWTLDDQDTGTVKYTFPVSVPVPAGGYVLVYTSTTTTDTDCSDGLCRFSMARGSTIWNDGGDDVLLKAVSGSTTYNVDYMAYGSGAAVNPPPAGMHWTGTPNPGAPSSTSTSLQRVPSGVDTDAVTDWTVRAPTPGAAN